MQVSCSILSKDNSIVKLLNGQFAFSGAACELWDPSPPSEILYVDFVPQGWDEQVLDYFLS